MNQTGVRSTGCDLQARTKRELGADMIREDGPITVAFFVAVGARGGAEFVRD
jgi:hypothetical protein